MFDVNNSCIGIQFEFIFKKNSYFYNGELIGCYFTMCDKVINEIVISLANKFLIIVILDYSCLVNKARYIPKYIVKVI